VKPVWYIARLELQLLWRDGVARAALALVALLVLLALATTATEQRTRGAERQRASDLAAAHWQMQPDRHPHRVVHFGDFAFKPVSPLSLFEPGVESFTGQMLFLEGHRQNSANFSAANQTGALLRFGELSPAYLLHTVVPLLLIFLGSGLVARDRPTGFLRWQLSLGTTGRQLLAGKALALVAVAAALLSPLGALVLWSVTQAGDTFARAALLALGYGAHLTLVALLVVVVSATAREPRSALLVLLAGWALLAIALPRGLSTAAVVLHPTPSRLESERAAERELAQLGDSHDPNDPHFAALRARTLAEHGVSRIEDLPFNWGGLVMLEGERLSSERYARHAAELLAGQERQSRFADHFGWLDPFLALRTLSRSAAGTDLAHHAHFLSAAEQRRYQLVQALNELHRTAIRFENDRGQRLDSAHWQELPRAAAEPLPLTAVAPRIGRAATALGAWLALAVVGLALAGRRLETAA
jgi:ABC-2 type transport system permease protein